MKPDYLTDAESARVAAHHVVTEVTADFAQAEERHAQAKEALQAAIASHLLDRTDSSLRKRLEQAKEAEHAAQDALQHAEMYRSAAEQNLANAEAHLLAMQRRQSSDIVLEAGTALKEACEEFDKALATLQAIAKRGDQAAKRMEDAARLGLDIPHSNPSFWRWRAVDSLKDLAQSVSREHWTPYTSKATQGALERFCAVRSTPLYSPSTPDPDFGEAAQ